MVLYSANLTERDRQVLHLAVEGLSTKTIARELGLSPRTVEVHRGNVMRKFGVHNAASLVRLALRPQV